MTSYLGPVPNIPTLEPVNIYEESQIPLKDQVDEIYTKTAFVVNDKKRRDQYLQQEDITTDTWVDGLPIFTKTVAISAIPVGATTNYPHGIAGLKTLVDIRIMVTNGTTQRLLGYAHPTAANAAAVDVNATNIVITTGASFTANMAGYAIMQYTKQ